MAATTTPSISWLIPKLRNDFPSLQFSEGETYAWQPSSQTIVYRQKDSTDPWQLLHELGHALLGHSDYKRDIELLGYERDAWQKAQELTNQYKIGPIPDDTIQAHLDSYRDWLHARSQCVACEQTGLQTAQSHYTCPHCHTSWRVNDARMCQLKRYKS